MAEKMKMAENPRNTGDNGGNHNILYFIVGGLVVIAAVFFSCSPTVKSATATAMST